MPLVSVVIPTHNRAEMLRAALDSVVAQTFHEYEIIVVDDGSTDHTRDVARDYGDLVTYIYHHNQGQSRTRNAGIHASHGAYVAFLDDDDIWYPRKLELQTAILESRPDVDLVYGSIFLSEDRGRFLFTSELLASETWIERLIFEGPRMVPAGASTVMVRRDSLLQSGLFDPMMAPLDDWELWCRIALRGGRFACVHEPIAEYRMHRTNMVHDKLRMQAARFTVLEKLFAAPETPGALKARRRPYLSQQWLQAGNERYNDSQFGAAREAWCKAVRLNPSMATPRLLFLIAKTLCGTRMRHLAYEARRALASTRSVEC